MLGWQDAKRCFFRWTEERFDTASPQGKFTQQVLRTAAEFERALIRERTRPGLASARAAASGLSGPAGASGRELAPSARDCAPPCRGRTCCGGSTHPAPSPPSWPPCDVLLQTLHCRPSAKGSKRCESRRHAGADMASLGRGDAVGPGEQAGDAAGGAKTFESFSRTEDCKAISECQ